MNYQLKLAFRFITREKSSFIPAVITIALTLLVLQVAVVNLYGIYSGSLETLVNYQYGNVYITKQKDFITKSDFSLVHWIDRLPYVEGAAPRISTIGTINYTSPRGVINDYNIQVVGVHPYYDLTASTLYQSVQGHYIISRNDIVLGAIVQKDLGYPRVGDTVQIEVTERDGKPVLKRLTIVGISHAIGSKGFDNGVILHIDTLRELLQRTHQTQSIIVRLNDPLKEKYVKDLFLLSYPSKEEKFRAQTVEEAAEQQIDAAGANNSFAYTIAHFGILSPSPVIVLVMMKQIASKKRGISLLQIMGASKKDVYLIFVFQAIIIGLAGMGLGDALGLIYTFIAATIHITYNGSIPLDVQLNWMEIARNDLWSLAATILVAIYPIRKALKINMLDFLEKLTHEKILLGVNDASVLK